MLIQAGWVSNNGERRFLSAQKPPVLLQSVALGFGVRAAERSADAALGRLGLLVRGACSKGWEAWSASNEYRSNTVRIACCFDSNASDAKFYHSYRSERINCIVLRSKRMSF
jgi:hypothetical protein